MDETLSLVAILICIWYAKRVEVVVKPEGTEMKEVSEMPVRAISKPQL